MADTLGCFRAADPASCDGVRLSTGPVRVLFEAGRPFGLAWVAATEDGATPGFPRLGARVEMDSVWVSGGRLVSVYSSAARSHIGGTDVHAHALAQPVRVEFHPDSTGT